MNSNALTMPARAGGWLGANTQAADNMFRNIYKATGDIVRAAILEHDERTK